MMLLKDTAKKMNSSVKEGVFFSRVKVVFQGMQSAIIFSTVGLGKMKKIAILSIQMELSTAAVVSNLCFTSMVLCTTSLKNLYVMVMKIVMMERMRSVITKGVLEENTKIVSSRFLCKANAIS